MDLGADPEATPNPDRASLSRDASGRITFEKEDIPREGYRDVCKYIASHFTLAPTGGLVEGLDELFQEYRSGDVIVGLEWDVWSGFVIVAKNHEAEQLVKEMGALLESRRS